MGASVGVLTNASTDELAAFHAVKQAFENEEIAKFSEAEQFDRLCNVYIEQLTIQQAGPQAADVAGTGAIGPIGLSQITPVPNPESAGMPGHISEEVVSMLAMTVDECQALAKEVLAEAVRIDALTNSKEQAPADFSKSFAGTVQDTQAEKEFEALARGDVSGDPSNSQGTSLLLQPPQASEQELHLLRDKGTWLKYLGAKGCYMWIHSMTKELTAMRPDTYQDPIIEIVAEVADSSGGLFSCALTSVPEVVEHTVTQEQKTPLLLDTSPDGKVSAYFSYKAVLVDVSVLALGFQKSGVKVSDLMESVRARTVQALKAGATLTLRLGHLTSDQACFKGKLCKRDIFPSEIFQQGGAAMFSPASKPRCNLLFKEEEKHQGQCLVKADTFRFLVITSLTPSEFREKLQESLPLGYMKPIYVTT